MTASLLDGIEIDDSPAGALYPGWTAIDRQPVIGQFEVVVFQDVASRRQACWWVQEGLYKGSHVLALPPTVQNDLLTAMDPLFWPLAEGVLGGDIRDDARTFRTDLPETAFRELAGSWLGRHAPHAVFIAAGHADSGEALTCPDGKPVAEGRMKALLSAKRSGGTLIVSSPFSALPVRAQIEMKLGSSATAYRFHDEAENAVFYLVWDESAPDRRPSFYYPKGPLLISDAPAGPLFPGWILEWYARHSDHADAIRSARPFLPEDFGVGQASSLRAPRTTQDEPAASPPASVAAARHEQSAGTPLDTKPEALQEVPEPVKAPQRSFLPELPLDPAPVLQSTSKKGLFGRLKTLLGRHDR
ncbi:hypothetical protein [Gluconobacter thailandicus]|uniref:Uncharacterized protein n=1 Tax=Gluconobacter thailandicus TaxID=257438 RepID=A0AAP9ERH3_GLUTH|nr:hypothetical protein [Gluconobacter thailandicus]QEH95966.1 hypothetical protein FXF46_06515 [Gluconobacter thailandicus]